MIIVAHTILWECHGNTLRQNTSLVRLKLSKCLIRREHNLCAGAAGHWVARTRVFDEEVGGADLIGHLDRLSDSGLCSLCSLAPTPPGRRVIFRDNYSDEVPQK